MNTSKDYMQHGVHRNSCRDIKTNDACTIPTKTLCLTKELIQKQGLYATGNKSFYIFTEISPVSTNRIIPHSIGQILVPKTILKE